MADDEVDPLYLRFLGSLIEELGSKMYPSVTASVAELISNAWDADASNVWITIPLGRSVESDGSDEIVVIDDGIGMSREEAQSKYLIVGRKRRKVDRKMTTPSGRPLHGRKGIGKLAAFGTAKTLMCTTVKQSGEGAAFVLEYDWIRELDAGDDYQVPEFSSLVPLRSPEAGSVLAHGTEVRLSDLRSKRLPNNEQFRKSLARRFGVLNPEMRVFLNGEELQRFEMSLDIRFPKDGLPSSVRDSSREDMKDEETRIAIDNDWAIETLEEGEVRWWIGFTDKPIDAPELRGISVLAHEKMVQRPFMFGRSQGTAGQLGQEYLVGEVVANWIDDGIESEDDLVETNRDELQLEDERLQSFLAWGRSRLRWALANRNEIRKNKVLARVLRSEKVTGRLIEFTRREQRVFKNIGTQIANLPEVQDSYIEELMLEIMDAHDDKSVREMIEQIEKEDDGTQERIWSLVSEFGLIDARRTKSKIEARLQVIEKLEEMVTHGAREVPEIHNHVLANPWLLDPRWDLYGDEVELTKHLQDSKTSGEDVKGSIADYLFAIGPLAPTSNDEVVVVEIKRGTNNKGYAKKANHDEVASFGRYVVDAEEFFSAANSESFQPKIRGLMITQGFTERGQRQRKSLERVPYPIHEFKSWSAVLKDTRRLHLGWLELSSRRSGSESSVRGLTE